MKPISCIIRTYAQHPSIVRYIGKDTRMDVFVEWDLTNLRDAMKFPSIRAAKKFLSLRPSLAPRSKIVPLRKD